MGLFEGIGAALAGGVISGLFGRSNAKQQQSASRDSSTTAWNREYGAYKSRYQDTMADMRAAGLNPIMAAGGGFNVGSGPSASAAPMAMANAPQFNFASSAKDMTQAEVNQEKITETFNKSAKILQETRVLNQKELETLANTGLLLNKHELISQQIDLTDQQRVKLAIEVKRFQVGLKRLEKQGNVYDNAYGTILSYLRETLGSIGALIQGVPSAAIMKH